MEFKLKDFAFTSYSSNIKGIGISTRMLEGENRNDLNDIINNFKKVNNIISLSTGRAIASVIADLLAASQHCSSHAFQSNHLPHFLSKSDNAS